MATTPSLMSLMVAMLAVSPQPSHGQLFGLGPCPDYQAETLFTDQKIAELKGSGHYSVLLSHNPDLECMSFDFIDDVKLSFNFKDMRRVDPVLQSERGRYTAHPTLFRDRGYIKVDMDRDGVLGSNPFGAVDLVPLLFTNTYDVWVTCTGLIAAHLEHSFVLVHEPVTPRTDGVTRFSATSANSSLLASTSEKGSSTSAGLDPVLASSGLQSGTSTQDNSINGTVGAASLREERDTAAAAAGLLTKAARQTLAADIRDDLIARGFPRANALRLKYNNCVD